MALRIGRTRHGDGFGSLRLRSDIPILGSMAKAGNLTNQLLVAMPGLEDPHFSQTVTLVCEHSDKGALGIVLNKPLTMRLSEVLTQMNLPARDDAVGGQIVLRGGPVHQDR